MDKGICPICDYSEAQYDKNRIAGAGDFINEISCPRCGRYTFQSNGDYDKPGAEI